MSSNEASLQKIYDEIVSMRRRQEEDKFLSKVDAIFGVLCSIMLFVLGFLVNNSLSQAKVNVPLLFYGLAAILVFVVVLVGQFVAILGDNIGFRFYFWAILINGIVQVPVQAASMYWAYLYHEPLAWFPLNLLSFSLVPYCLAILERRYFDRLRQRSLSKKANAFLFRTSDRKRNQLWYRCMYFFLLCMGVRLLISIPQYILVRSIYPY
jgi:hypothetical protein